MLNKLLPGFGTLFFSLYVCTSQAASVGTYTFDDNATVDTLDSGSGMIYNGTDWYYDNGSSWYISSNGSPWSATTAPVDATDNNLSTYLAAVNEVDPTVNMTLGFTDNAAINGSGDDLVLFFLFDQSMFDNNNTVTINGMTQSLSYSDVYDGLGNQVTVDNVNWDGQVFNNVLLTAATLDLSDFGLATDELISSLFISLNGNDPETPGALSMVAALNSAPAPAPVPLPAALILFLSGLAGLSLFSRHK